MNESPPVFESGDGKPNPTMEALRDKLEERYPIKDPTNDPILEAMEKTFDKNVEIVTQTHVECDVIIIKPTD